MAKINPKDLPNTSEVITALCDRCLGSGQEVKVFKIDTNPDFTVQMSLDVREDELPKLFKYLQEHPFVPQDDIFSGRNYAQPIAYWKHPDIRGGDVVLTINRYSPGFSLEIQKHGLPKPDSNEALIKTRVWTEKILNMPDSALDILYDDLHFLSSRRHSIDICGNGLFSNTGNLLYSSRDNRAYIIDVQPFIQKAGISPTQTKGYNTPFYMTRGLLPGAYCYAEEHSKDPMLISMRTEIVHRSIEAAKRNGVDDMGGYLKGNMDNMVHFWELQLRKLNIPEKYHEEMLNNVASIKQEHRYNSILKPLQYYQIRGFDD